MINHPSNARSRTTSTLLRRLQSAVTRVRYLLRNIAAPSPFSLISILRSSTALLRPRPPRRLSFKDRRPSTLADVCDLDSLISQPCDAASDQPQSNASSSGSTSARVLHRTSSSPGSIWERQEADEEIDHKAETYITNFYRQLRLEKQVSLELRYCRGYSFGSSPDPSPTFSLSLTSP